MKLKTAYKLFLNTTAFNNFRSQIRSFWSEYFAIGLSNRIILQIYQHS